MDYIQLFNNFAADFELAFSDDDWSRLEKHLTEDATYHNVGGPDPKSCGCLSILEFLRTDVNRTDRRFDSRTLTALTEPAIKENRLSRKWRCRYTLSGTPDLVLEGEARYRFSDNLIDEIEQELTTESLDRLESWMTRYGDRL